MCGIILIEDRGQHIGDFGMLVCCVFILLLRCNPKSVNHSAAADGFLFYFFLFFLLLFFFSEKIILPFHVNHMK